MPIALLILGAFMVYTMQAVLYNRFFSYGLSISVSFQEHSAVEGEDSLLVETVINRKLLPLLTLQAKFQINGSLEFETMENTVITDNTYRNDIFSVMPYEKLIRKHIFHCKKRGYYHTNGIDVISYDLFLSRKSVKFIPNESVFYIYPKPASTQRLNVPFQRLMGTLLTKRFHMEDPFEFRNIRPYQLYDTMKDINWKASAKTGDLKVNVHNYTASQEVTIFLNLDSDTNWRFDALAEESIRIAAAYAALLLSRGIMTELVTNGIDVISGSSLLISSGAGQEHMTSINEGLARLDISRDVSPFINYLDEAVKNPSARSKLYIMISRVQKADLVKAFSRINTISPGSQWICPLHPDMKYTLGQEASFDCMEWEVEYGK